MNVAGSTARMRPQAVVDLIRIDDRSRDARCLPQQRPEFCGLGIGQVSDCGDVANRLHDQGSESERPDAVLNPPMLRLMDLPARQRPVAPGELASLTFRHGTQTAT